VDDDEPRRGGVFRMQIVLYSKLQSIYMRFQCTKEVGVMEKESKRVNIPYLQF
jgi:hypothetical protein